MKLRVYYNGDNPNLPWQLDQGPGTTVQYAEAVIIDKIGISGHDNSQDNVKEPRAWFEFIEARVEIRNGVARIY
jgi:hypothetical protein